ncbi:FAD binding domain protein [Aspergillus clavatus NRRL 1]|uniref:FAD binding domain protein n=1 Tax=Aspergillus clavatus (strain ATCC 1007 / CBS 513.65 / DSM 816 / NCTC 3887 / NRRL 1 / QM 1276 / 107) TaxID=344612 RepID=A1C4F9_ASPCL|nr:FAD binding domain protein [Aspergillus clavatus NRRL 1]EAW15299.1 FAD binding domain protein [Aspergillus clavatus NRRL 1]
MTGPKNVIDVLIIGAGPSGLSAALWLAQLGINFRIVDKRSDQPRIGQADGLNPKTMEIFESWDIHGDVTKLWEPATHETLWYRGQDEKLRRTDRYPSQPPPGVRWTHGTLQQGRVEEIMKKRIVKLCGENVEYHTSLGGLSIDTAALDTPGAYPCTVVLQKQQEEGTSTESIQAKYVIGADGGRSLTRECLDIEMRGDKGSSIWGVMDFAGSSDFPDFGATSIIRSDIDGSVDFVRREEGLVRMYVELNKGPQGAQIRREDITPELIIEKCQYMVRPYKLDVRQCVWWSAFTATQRLSSAASRCGRAFLVGDAVHTHSPVTGMGMNTSIQDSYNLVWKLAGVIKGYLNPSILATYDTERGMVARQLLEADRTTLELFEAKVGHESASLLERADDLRMFLAGRLIRYADALLTLPSTQRIGHFEAGECLPEVTITNHATGRPVHLHNALKANNSWCIIVFAGDVSLSGGMGRIHELAKHLEEARGATSGLLDALLVHCAPWDAIELADLPCLFFPLYENTGRDYTKIYIDEGSVYDEAGVDRKDGGLILVRPDRYIGWTGRLEETDHLKRYLSHIFLTRSKV